MIPEAVKAEIRRRHAAGESKRSIADVCGVNRNSVRNKPNVPRKVRISTQVGVK